jgi:dTDP-4-amino-4,6-dideoxygalactose transaminase
MVGATPLLIDIEPEYYTMRPDELAAVLDTPPPALPPIRAAIPVHLYGQPADLAPIMAACAKHGVAVIEDCSQAHGATLNGQKLGTFTEVAAFSLYPTKNLGALGDGGILATSDPARAARLAALRQYGWRTHYISDEAGVNSRLDELQATILRVKLRHIDAQNARRQTIAEAYDVALANSEIRPPARRSSAGHVFHQYVARVPNRASLQAQLRSLGIGTGVHYPMPVHLQPAYRGRVALGPSGCTASERASAEVLSLPMFPELTNGQVEQVCAALARLS